MPSENSKSGEAEAFRGGEVEEGALDFAAAFGEVLGDDEQVGAWVGGELLFAPEGAGGQLGLGVGGVVIADFAGRRAGGGFLPFSPGVEEAALDVGRMRSNPARSSGGRARRLARRRAAGSIRGADGQG